MLPFLVLYAGVVGFVVLVDLVVDECVGPSM